MPHYSIDDIRGILELLERHSSETLEDESTEFKEFVDAAAIQSALRDLAEDVSALANKKGGVIVIGIRDGKHVTRGHWSDQLVGAPEYDLVQLKERILDKLQPRIDLTVVRLVHLQKAFLVLRVPHRQDTLVGTTSGRYLIRVGRSNRGLSPHEITNLIKSQTAFDWSGEALDVEPSHALDPGALRAALHEFRKRRKIESIPTTGKFLEAIGATKNGQLTKGGLLFLGREDAIQSHLGHIEYRFSWRTTSGAFIVNDVWHGCTWWAIERAKGHFDRCNTYYHFEHEGRKHSAPILDPSAFHEAFLNALVHRDYSTDGMITISFIGDRITITSPGGFYGGVTADNIALHEPRHRNKALARSLMIYNQVDRAGAGVPRMNLASLKYGRKLPVFKEVFGNVEVTMQAHLVREPVFLLAMANEKKCGLPELLILNAVCETGFVCLLDLARELGKVVGDPWEALSQAIRRVPGIEQCATEAGPFLRVNAEWLTFFKVSRFFDAHANGDHLALYKYVRNHGAATAAELASVLGYANATQAASVLRNVPYLTRTPKVRPSMWQLKEG